MLYHHLQHLYLPKALILDGTRGCGQQRGRGTSSWHGRLVLSFCRGLCSHQPHADVPWDGMIYGYE
jgi:hypothetical protein